MDSMESLRLQDEKREFRRISKGLYNVSKCTYRLLCNIQRGKPDPLVRYQRPLFGPEKCHGMGGKGLD